MGVKNDTFHVTGKTQNDNNLFKSRENGQANAETQFLKISFGTFYETFEKSAKN
jgi:hypothetical protein